MVAQRQSIDERFYQEAEQRLNSSQYYQALLQGTGEAVTKIELSIHYLLGNSAVTREKIDFIIGRMEAAYIEEDRPALEGDGGDDTSGNPPQETTTHSGPSLRLHDERSPYLYLNDFHRDLEELDIKITEAKNTTAQDTSERFYQEAEQRLNSSHCH